MKTHSLPQSGRLVHCCVVLLFAGSALAAGYFLSPADSAGAVDENQAVSSSRVPTDKIPIPSAATHRFMLSSEDIHDHHQAPQLVSDGQGTVWVAWDSRMPDRTNALFLCRSDDGGMTFDPPQIVRRVPVHEREVIMGGNKVKRASRLWPRLAWAKESLYLAWLEPDTDDPSQLGLRVSSSNDRGVTFEQVIPLSSPDAVRPGFIGLSVDNRGSVAAAWLDGRSGSQQLFASILSDGHVEEQLVYAGPDGNGICPCCTVAITAAEDGTQYVAFRNHRDGYRDIWLAVRTPNGDRFEQPQRIVEDRWTFDGCPHDGPSIGLHEDRLHVVWMDAHSGIQRIYHAHSMPDGQGFTAQPIAAEADGAQGHPFVQLSDDGFLHVVWDQALDAGNEAGNAEPHQNQTGGRAVFHAVSSDNGTSFSRPRPVNPVAGAFQTRPALVRVADGALVVAWCELSEQGKQIVVHPLPFADSP